MNAFTVRDIYSLSLPSLSPRTYLRGTVSLHLGQKKMSVTIWVLQMAVKQISSRTRGWRLMAPRSFLSQGRALRTAAVLLGWKKAQPLTAPFVGKGEKP